MCKGLVDDMLLLALMDSQLVWPLHADIARLRKSCHASRDVAQTKPWPATTNKATELAAAMDGPTVEKNDTFLIVRIAIHRLVLCEEWDNNGL